MSALLALENLSVAFDTAAGRVDAVRNVSLALAPGEVLGIVGESGSGKSVTCRAILGLLPPRARVSGAIVHAGRNLAALDAKALHAVRGREISMIFQNPSSHLDPLMSIGDHVAEPLSRHFGLDARAARAEALKLLEVVRIRDAAARYEAFPHQLSGGMKQRVLIASALACRPRLLLADEPTTALDVTVQSSILELLRRLNRDRGLSMIFVSHDLGVIAEICDRVVVMRDGEVVEQGTLSEVAARPRHDYTRLLIGSQPGRLAPLTTDAAPEREALLQVNALEVHFSQRRTLVPPGGRRAPVVRALDKVSFEVRAGECFGVVGESGSGKSTVARAVVRLVRSTGGEIRYAGRPIERLAGAELAAYRRQVQMVFQSPYDSLNPRMTVRQTIAEPLWRHRLLGRAEALERAEALMDAVELPRALAGRRPRQLSGGQCQRVGIARACALSPRLLIADEVTSALDVTIQAQVLKLLARLKQTQDLTIVYISHDLAVVRRFCDRVAVFRDGRLIETGPTARVFEFPRSDYTRALIAAAPDLDTVLARELAS